MKRRGCSQRHRRGEVTSWRYDQQSCRSEGSPTATSTETGLLSLLSTTGVGGSLQWTGCMLRQFFATKAVPQTQLSYCLKLLTGFRWCRQALSDEHHPKRNLQRPQIGLGARNRGVLLEGWSIAVCIKKLHVLQLRSVSRSETVQVRWQVRPCWQHVRSQFFVRFRRVGLFESLV